MGRIQHKCITNQTHVTALPKYLTNYRPSTANTTNSNTPPVPSHTAKHKVFVKRGDDQHPSGSYGPWLLRGKGMGDNFGDTKKGGRVHICLS